MYEFSFIYMAFRLLNFLIFLAVIVVVYNRYIKQSLIDQMNTDEQERQRLEQRLMQLTHSAEQQQHARIMQKIEGEALLARMHEWSDSVRERQQEKAQQRAKRLQEAMERRKVMLVNFTEQSLFANAQAIAIANAEKILSERFVDTAKSHVFIARGISKIEQE